MSVQLRWSNQKLTLLGAAASISCAVLGWYGMVGHTVRGLDQLLIFGGGFFAGLACVRFFRHLSVKEEEPAAAAKPATTVAPATPASASDPR